MKCERDVCHLCIAFLLAWMFGLVTFHVGSGLIHLLLVCALSHLVVHFVTGPASLEILLRTALSEPDGL
jgi:hypothetical protein